jgi:hypothetical protein
MYIHCTYYYVNVQPCIVLKFVLYSFLVIVWSQYLCYKLYICTFCYWWDLVLKFMFITLIMYLVHVCIWFKYIGCYLSSAGKCVFFALWYICTLYDQYFAWEYSCCIYKDFMYNKHFVVGLYSTPRKHEHILCILLAIHVLPFNLVYALHVFSQHELILVKITIKLCIFVLHESSTSPLSSDILCIYVMHNVPIIVSA